MLDGMSDSIQGSRIENLHSREVDRQSPTGLIFIIIITGDGKVSEPSKNKLNQDPGFAKNRNILEPESKKYGRI